MNVFRGRIPHKVVPFAILTVSILLACFAFLTTSQVSAAPTTMNFQGRLADASGNTVANGTYNMQFRLFTVASGGSATWTETRETTNRVTVTNGLFSVQLGAVTPLSASLFSGNDVYFEITLPTPATATCGTASCASWESAMTPRHKMATSAYAFNSETLDGLDSTAFGQITANNAWTGTNTVSLTNAAAFRVQNASSVAALTVNTSGNIVQIGSSTTDATAVTFILDNYNQASDPTGVNGAMYYNTNSNKLRCYQNGSWADCITTDTTGANTALSNIASTNLSAALNTTSGNLTLQTTTSGNIILNPVGTVELQKNTNVTGTLAATTSVTAPIIDRANAGTLTIGGTNATSITLSDNTTLGAGLSLTLSGGTTASRPGSPVEGMVYFDSDTDQLLTYANGKWQADSTDAVLVAASNSSQSDKDAADYVADGNTGAANDGDQVQINSALTAGSGKKVVLLAGTYVADATILIPNNTILSGVGNGTLIELADLDVTENLIENSDTTTGTSITIRDMRIDGRKDLNTAGTQYNIYLIGMGAGAGTRQGATLTGLTVVNSRDTGISLNSAFNNTITGNTVIGNALNGGIRLTGASSNNTITGNTVQGNSYGITVSASSSNNTITGNTAQGNTSYGIFISSSNNTITGNTAQGNVWGITVNSGSYNTVSGNTVQGNTTYGIYISSSAASNTITGNTVHDSGGATANNGIYLDAADSNTFSDNTITDTSCTTTCHAINILNSTSDNNYLSGNTFSTTSGTATVNDSGTGTRYAGQATTQGGLDLRFKQTASTTAFQIQSATGVAALTADTSAGRIQVGSSTTDANIITFALDSYNNGTDPTGVNGAMYYNTSLNKFRCYQNGAWTDCVTAGGSSATTALDNLASTNINAALNATSNNLTLQTTTSGNIILNAAGTTELQDDTNVGGNLTVAATKSLTLVGGTTASRPGSPVEGMVYYDSDTDKLLTYSNGKWQQDRTDAILVAASNSSQSDKDAADYVADGNAAGANNGDQIEINSALTAGSGKKVVLLAGTYVADATILIPNNTTLAGVGNGTLIELGDLDATENLIENSDTTTGTGVTLRDIRLDGRSDLNTAGTQHGIVLNNMGGGSGASARVGAKLTNLMASRFRNNGIELNASSNNIITGNSSIGNSTGFNLNTSSLHNTISGNTAQGNSSTGIYLTTSSSNNTISGNTTQGNTSYGIYINQSDNNTVSGNTMQAGSYGLTLVSSHYNTVTGNTAQGNTTYGINVSVATYNTITGNTVQGATSFGISLTTTSNYNAITGNRIHNTGGATTNDGIYINASDSNTISSNIITDTSCSTNCYAINIFNVTSDNNYLSDNVFSTTSGTAIINDTGVGTRYAGQTVTQAGLDVQFKQAASTTAFQIQSATGVAALTADTSTGRIQVGSSTTDANIITFALDSYNNGTDPTGVNGAMYYNTSLNKFRCYQNGAWADCVGASMSLNNLASTNINAALNATSANLTLQTTTSGNIILNAVGTTELQDDTNVGGNLTVAATKSLRLVGGNTASRPGSPTEGMVYYDSETDQLLTYTGTKWQADSKAAKFIVAASNSSQAIKDGAQYVANGEDSAGSGIGTLDGDQIEINNALTAAAAAGGGTVYLAEGTYTTDAAISIPNNVTLAGSGNSTLIQLGNFGATSVSINTIVNTDSTTGTGIGIRDIKLDGRRSLNSAGTQRGVYLNNMGGGSGGSFRPGAVVSNVVSNNFINYGF